VIPWSEYASGGVLTTVDPREDEDLSERCAESRRDSALTVWLADAVKSSGKTKTKRDGRRQRHSEMTSDEKHVFATSSAASKTSSLTPKRRGKGTAIYIERPQSTTSDDDVTAGND